MAYTLTGVRGNDDDDDDASEGTYYTLFPFDEDRSQREHITPCSLLMRTEVRGNILHLVPF